MRIDLDAEDPLVRHIYKKAMELKALPEEELLALVRSASPEVRHRINQLLEAVTLHHELPVKIDSAILVFLHERPSGLELQDISEALINRIPGAQMIRPFKAIVLERLNKLAEEKKIEKLGGLTRALYKPVP